MLGKRFLPGFTLIEMLIGMTLLSIMVVLLFGSLRIAAESWNAGEGKIVEVNQKVVVYQFFKRQFSVIRPVPALAGIEGDEAAVNTLEFKGYGQSMRFVAALPLSAARKGLQVFQIQLDNDQPSILTVALSPYQTNQMVEPKPEVLLKNIKSLSFTYFGKKDEGMDSTWSDTWAASAQLPKLIKLSIGLNDGSYWPDMVFPLKINSSVNALEMAINAGNPKRD